MKCYGVDHILFRSVDRMKAKMLYLSVLCYMTATDNSDTQHIYSASPEDTFTNDPKIGTLSNIVETRCYIIIFDATQ